MHDPRLDKLAEVLVRHCAKVRAGDLVTILGEPEPLAPIQAVFEAVLRAGGQPSFHAKSERLHELLLRHGSGEQLQHVSPFEEHRLARCDVLIVLMHPLNTQYLARIDPRRFAAAQAARRQLLTLSLQRKAQGESRYVLAEIPTNAAAQQNEMSLRDYADRVYRACFLHLPDPVGAWQTLRAQQERVREHLQSTRTLRFHIPAGDRPNGRRYEGTNFTVDVSGRTWINHAGSENLPDGEVESGPRTVDGLVNFNLPAVYRGRVVEGVRLRFKDGRVTEASATRGEDYLISMLDQDAGARVAGEIALGTNYHITESFGNPFFDEKIGGTFHLALGAGYPETGNTNESALHWDMVCDLRPSAGFQGCPGGSVHADGELIQRAGRFMIPGWPGTDA